MIDNSYSSFMWPGGGKGGGVEVLYKAPYGKVLHTTPFERKKVHLSFTFNCKRCPFHTLLLSYYE